MLKQMVALLFFTFFSNFFLNVVEIGQVLGL